MLPPRVFHPDRALATLLFAVGFAMLCLAPHVGISGPDIWGNVFVGKWILQQGRLPRTDPFSYTAAGRPWIDHEWVVQLMMYGAYRLGGPQGLIAWRMIFVVAMLAAILRLVLARARSVVGRSAAFLASVPLVSVGMSYRPVVVSLPILLGYGVLLDRARRGDPRWYWAAVPVMWLWANLHGSFAVGLGLHAIAAVCAGLATLRDPAARRWAGHAGGSLIVAAAVTLLNPYGPGLWTVMWRHVGGAHAVSEWYPLPVVIGDRLGETAILVLVVAALIFSQRPKSLTAMAQLGSVVFLPFLSVRHLPLAGVLMPLLATEHVDDCVRRYVLPVKNTGQAAEPSNPRSMSLMLYGAAVVVLVAYGLGGGDSLRMIRPDPGENPLKAVAGLKHHQVTGNLLVYYNWALPVLYHCHQDVKLAFDGRERTVYPPQIEAAYIDFFRGSGRWDRLLTDYPTEWILFPPKLPVLDRLRANPDWQIVEENDDWMLLGRRDRVSTETGVGKTGYESLQSDSFPGVP